MARIPGASKGRPPRSSTRLPSTKTPVDSRAAIRGSRRRSRAGVLPGSIDRYRQDGKNRTLFEIRQEGEQLAICPKLALANGPRLAADAKRDHILAAARAAFEADGLEGASLRSIAHAPATRRAALYFHFESKRRSMARCCVSRSFGSRRRSRGKPTRSTHPTGKLVAAALAFYGFYRENPRDLDLGFYLFRVGMHPMAIDQALDRDLNDALMLRSSRSAPRRLRSGASPDDASRATVDLFAHATGLLLLLHTGRIRMFGVSADDMMADHVRLLAARLGDRA